MTTTIRLVTYPAIDFAAFGSMPADTGLRFTAVASPWPGPAPALLTYLTGVLDSVVTEAEATRGLLRLGIAVPIVTLDRVQRGIVTKAEAVLMLDLWAGPALVCSEALVTRNCPLGHSWVTATTAAKERFELPLLTSAHRP